jgi:hypothetical protein
MFKIDEIEKVAVHALEVVNVLNGLTVGEAQLVLKQAENAIMGAQRVIATSIEPVLARQVIKFHLENC